MHFADRLIAAIRRRGNPVMAGIDPRVADLPAEFRPADGSGPGGVAGAIEGFGRALIDVVAPLVPAVKFQAAFYEAAGPDGMVALRASIRHAKASGLIVVVDGKRNDIGSTAEAYAAAYLGGDGPEAPWDADALTINPYLGSDGIAPFSAVGAPNGRGAFVLVRTSNPSASEFQDLVADGQPVYRHVAERLAGWASASRGESGYGALGAVVGATAPAQLAELRSILPGVLFLVPGYGAQGGSAADVAAAFDADGLGAVVNNSRGIASAFRRPEFRDRFGDDWRVASARATLDMIDDLARHTPAGRLIYDAAN